MKGDIIARPVFYFLTGVLFMIGLVFLLSSFKIEPKEVHDASADVVAATVLQRIVASQDCLSTGDAGVLDAQKLDWAVGSTELPGRIVVLKSPLNEPLELPCAYTPDGGAYVTVRELGRWSSDGAPRTWNFGYKYPGDGIEKTLAVTVYDPTTKRTNPAVLEYKFSFRNNDPLLYITDQAAKVFYTDRQIGREIGGLQLKKTLYFEKTDDNGAATNVVCAQYGSAPAPVSCKALYDGLKINIDLGKTLHFREEGSYEVHADEKQDGVYVTLDKKG